MNDTDTEVMSRARDTSAVINDVRSRLKRVLPHGEAGLAADFAALFLARAPALYLSERSPVELARLTADAFAFLRASRPDRVDVRVFNPAADPERRRTPVTVIRTNVGERPFIVDSIREYLHSRDLTIEHFIYPLLGIVRHEGRILRIVPPGDAEERESLIHCEISRVTDPAVLESLQEELEHRLADVVRATDDFRPMLAGLNSTMQRLDARSRELPDLAGELEEIRAFLAWLRDDGFVFLGHRRYDIADDPDTGEPFVMVERGSGLGILRDEEGSGYVNPVPLAAMPDTLRHLLADGPLLLIGKTNTRSTVHRLAHMDYIGVKKLDPGGRQVGEERFLGLFTSKAYGDHADRIPILRQKLRWILEDAGAQKGAHDYKEINTIFNSMPKEELFLSSAREIAKDVRTALTSYHTTGVQLTRREDPLRRGASFMVIIPREKFSAKARKAIEAAFVNALDGEVLNYHLAMGGGEQARLHFYLRVRPELLDVVTDLELKRLVQELTRDWTDRVGDELGQVRPRNEARRLAHRYATGFGADYRAIADPGAAARDILQLEAMVADGRDLSIALSNPKQSAVAPGDRVTELRLYRLGPRLVLSHFMPTLENAGLRVIAEKPAQLRGSGVPEGAVHTFAVQTAGKSPLDLGEVGPPLVDAILAVSAGDATNDRLNALVPAAGLAWREVEVLRAYSSYAFQLGAVPSRDSIVDALLNYPRIARLLFAFFETRFRPGKRARGRRKADMDAMRAKLLAALNDVYLLSDDRALRHLLTLIGATVRTNYYATGGGRPTRRSGGVPYMSFKVMARAMTSLTRTPLLFEAWVRSARMEGVHLRGARVARGGIRYSDRPDDFRTEVLGLAETQIVKNSVIVPAGSKGGFVILDQPYLSVAIRSEVERQYRTLMRGLLDLTDNVRGGRPVPPDGVVSYDDPDPYLVVAADKGTAGFSDVANAVAGDYGFWLGDAFASGGSNGYGHKELAITARGAWECVKRHFREMGKDIQSEPFTVVGIGDMSGDVFGNGMLLSPSIRLIAAFDHRHIFIDPDPDPRASFEERERLFHKPGSSWADYDASVMSPGGIIVRRGSKEVELSPEAHEALGIAGDPGRVSGEELVRLVLRAEAELFWNGGIGTYVKGSDETHADVADPSNIPVRVDASELRVKVVGEGGNLGLTQRARIEFALAGGRLNVDALDNSGGVSLSDREVNLKILLNAVVEEGRMTVAERNRMLRELADTVSGQVLLDNASQSLAVSLDLERARDGVDDFRQLISELERDGFFDRAREDLPTWEQLLERDEAGSRLTRPELCVLLAHAKLHLMRRLLKGTLIDDPVASGYLARYFPPAALSAAGESGLASHRLGREIVASQLTNDLVDLMGAGFVHRMMRDSGASADEVARAWLVASRLSGHRQLLADLREREREAGTGVAYRWYMGLSRVLDRTTRWVLGNAEREEIDSLVGRNFTTLRELQHIFPDVVSGEDRLTFERLVSAIQEVGPGADIAPALATLRFLDQLMDILRVARDTGTAPVYAARAYYAVSELLEIPWLRHAIDECARDERWEQRAARALNDDLTRAHHRIANFSAAAAAGRDAQPGGVAHVLTALRSREVAYFGELLTELRAETTLTLSGLAVAVRAIMVLSERTAKGAGAGEP